MADTQKDRHTNLYSSHNVWKFAHIHSILTDDHSIFDGDVQKHIHDLIRMSCMEIVRTEEIKDYVRQGY